LVQYFLNRFSTRLKKGALNMSPEAMDVMLHFHWPGNVRQLENVIERAFALGVKETIEVSDLPSEIRESWEPSRRSAQPYNLRENEIGLIRGALHEADGNKSKAAELLGINLSTLYRKIKKLGSHEWFCKVQIEDSHLANNEVLFLFKI